MEHSSVCSKEVIQAKLQQPVGREKTGGIRISNGEWRGKDKTCREMVIKEKCKVAAE